jgi:hypothetical protein
MTDEPADVAAPRPDVTIGAITPEPTTDEVAAIVAAIEMAWPKPQPPTRLVTPSARWRFSGRWWAKPVPARRDRPY